MFKKLKDKIKGDDSSEKPSYGTDQHNLMSNNPYYQHSQQQQPQQHNIAPTEKYQAPPGPPPNQGSSSSNTQYTAPPGPPPSHQPSGYVPPSGPPPSYPQQPPPSWEPPPYHDWTVIPDTALLPPPPSMGYDSSPTANATAEEGDRALEWTNTYPLWPPQNLQPSTHAAIQNGQLALLKPPFCSGDIRPQQQAGHWTCRTHAKCRDSSILTNLPMYSVFWDSPLNTQRSKTIYFELKVLNVGRGGFSLSEADAGIAIGFVAPPYPTFRLPGWERASLGVHGDDGRKYVNDAWGGNDFTTAFKPGETVGIGITFSIPRNPPSYEQSQQGGMLDIDVFFTRNGVKEGGWDGNEELDTRSVGGNTGLRGECDLFPAIGVFGGVEFDVFFHPSQWLYKPY
ncbi:spla ryanodine receptor subgroup [Pyrenophora teres f. maculata]|nr:spla ryanodine receptor subgroup [Pyrenophora teres f. maculata]